MIRSIAPGKEGALKTRPDGTIIDGHHRIAILRERGIKVDELPRVVLTTNLLHFQTAFGLLQYRDDLVLREPRFRILSSWPNGPAGELSAYDWLRIRGGVPVKGAALRVRRGADRELTTRVAPPYAKSLSPIVFVVPAPS